MLHILNRLLITGEITIETPLCVIIEVAKSFGLKIDETETKRESYINHILRTINELEIKSITDFNDITLKLVVRFVNNDKNITWSPKNLITAFNHLVSFYIPNEPCLPEEGFIIGQKTDQHPYAYNATILYRLCKYYGLKTNRSTTLFQMGQSIRYLINTTDSLRDIMTSFVETMSKSQIINLMMSEEFKINESPNIKNISSIRTVKKNSRAENLSTVEYLYDRDILTSAFQKLLDTERLILRIYPHDHNEAIILAAIIYGIDLTETINPYYEFLSIKESNISENRYIPKTDVNFRTKYLKNPLWYDVRKTWSPNIPCIYKNEDLKILAISEGYENEVVQGQDPYELLSLSRLLPNFYLGRHPNLTKSVTPIELENIDEIEPYMLISYGVGTTFEIFTITELTDYFSRKKSFENPLNISETFSNQNINKLVNICTEFYDQDTQLGIYYKNLYNVIAEVEEFQKTKSVLDKKLRNIYFSVSESDKNLFKKCLNYLFEMGLYMRGWKVENDTYPISISTYPIECQHMVDNNSFQAIKVFEHSVHQLPKSFQNIFTSLPLIKIHHNSINVSFAPIIDEDQGSTIMRRVEIVKNDENDYACIRISSNFFLYSYYYYMKLLDLSPEFDIKNVAHIS